MRVTYGRGSVLLWRRFHMSRTFAFVDDVMSTHNGQKYATQRAYTETDPPARKTGPRTESAAKFTKYLTIYRKIIIGLS